MLEHAFVGPTTAKTIVLVLHGLGDSMEGWKPIARELNLPGVRFCFVNAPEPYYDGYSWFPIPGFTGDCTARDMAQGIRASRALLTELLDQLESKFDLRRENMVLLGFSQGCLMVLDQALRSERIFHGVLGISGFIGLIEEYPAAFGKVLAKQNILMTHGTWDQVLPLEGTQKAVEHLKKLGAPIDLRTYPKEHSVHPDELPLWKSLITDDKDR
jgi:phospholipase/carboxylesterase